MPSAGVASVRAAPTKARRASSSPDSTVIGIPPAASTASASSSRLGAPRIAAVATVTISPAPASRAMRAWLATTSAVSAIFSAGMAPPLERLFPMRVKARSVTSSRRRPSSTSATSSLVVLLPMSMQP